MNPAPPIGGGAPAPPGPEGGDVRHAGLRTDGDRRRSLEESVVDQVLTLGPGPGRPRPAPPSSRSTGGASAASPTRSTTSWRATTSSSSSPPTVRSLDAIERSLRLADDVVRHKLIRLPDREATRRGLDSEPAPRLQRPERLERPRCPTATASPSCGNITRDPELRFTPSGQATPPSAWPSTAAGRTARAASGRRRSPSSTSWPGASWPRTSPSPRQGRPGHRHRPPRAALLGDPGRREAVASSRSSPTRSAPACAGPPPASPRTSAAAGDGGGGGGGGGVRRRRRRQPPAATRRPAGYDNDEEPF